MSNDQHVDQYILEVIHSTFPILRRRPVVPQTSFVRIGSKRYGPSPTYSSAQLSLELQELAQAAAPPPSVWYLQPWPANVRVHVTRYDLRQVLQNRQYQFGESVRFETSDPQLFDKIADFICTPRHAAS